MCTFCYWDLSPAPKDEWRRWIHWAVLPHLLNLFNSSRWFKSINRKQTKVQTGLSLNTSGFRLPESPTRLWPIDYIQKGQVKFFFKNGPTPASLLVYFWSFQKNNKIFTTNQCEKMSCPSSIRCRDLKARLLARESPLITTWPGLRPKVKSS